MSLVRKVRDILGGRAVDQTELQAAQALVAEWTGKRDRLAAEHQAAVEHERHLAGEALHTRDASALLEARTHRGALRERLEVTAASLAVAEERLAPLVAREAEAGQAERWAAAEALFGERHKALIAVERATKVLAQVVLDDRIRAGQRVHAVVAPDISSSRRKAAGVPMPGP